MNKQKVYVNCNVCGNKIYFGKDVFLSEPTSSAGFYCSLKCKCKEEGRIVRKLTKDLITKEVYFYNTQRIFIEGKEEEFYTTMSIDRIEGI